MDNFGLSSFLCVIFNSQLFSMLYLLFFRTLPEDIYVKYLDESHAAEKDKIWPYSRPGTEQYLANEIKNNFGLGKLQTILRTELQNPGMYLGISRILAATLPSPPTVF